MSSRNVKVYALSTCGWCHKTLKWMEDNKVACDTVFVDKVEGPKKDEILSEVKQFNPSRSFPTVVIDGRTVVVGFKPEVFEEEILK